MSATAGLALVDVSVRFGSRSVIDSASAFFDKGAQHAVVGRSGAGKSVLLKAATGLLPLDAGEVRWGETVARAGDAAAFAALRQRVLFVHQDPALLDDLTVLDNMRFPLQRKGLSAPQQQARLERWINALDLAEVLPALPRALAPGQLRKVALCRALCLEPEALIVDEPTTGLDPRAARDVDSALSALARAGTTLITITHDLRALAAIQPTLHWIDGGQVRYTGPYRAGDGERPAPLQALLAGGLPPPPAGS